MLTVLYIDLKGASRFIADVGVLDIALPRSKYYGDNLCAWAESRIETDNDSPEIFLPEPEKPYILIPEPKSEPGINSPKLFGVNQDPPGKSGRRITRDYDSEVWAKEMEDGSFAVGLFNIGEYENTIAVHPKDLGFEGKYRVRDLWRQEDIGNFTGVFEMKVPKHGAGFVRIYN